MTTTRVLPMVMVSFLGGLYGCDRALTWLDELAAEMNPPPAEATESATPEEEPTRPDELPQRPADSFAHSETEVIAFRNILQNEEMSREERIQALLKLGPAALQDPANQNSGTGNQPTQTSNRQTRDRAPKEWELANARKRVPVALYSTAWCGVCKRARSYFEKERISFVEYDVDKNASARAEYLALNPRRSVPTIKIGNEVVVGFSEGAVDRALDDAARARLN